MKALYRRTDVIPRKATDSRSLSLSSILDIFQNCFVRHLPFNNALRALMFYRVACTTLSLVVHVSAVYISILLVNSTPIQLWLEIRDYYAVGDSGTLFVMVRNGILQP